MLRLEKQSHQEGKLAQLILSDSHTNLQKEILCAKTEFDCFLTVNFWVLRSLNRFYWVLPSLIVFLMGFTGFTGSTGRNWIFMGFNELDWFLLGFTRLIGVLLNFIGSYWVLLGFTEFD